MRSRKRSSCASGSGYVPSYSIGFCVARTRNGRSRRFVPPSIVTCRSCIASSNAACVFGGARLISSASSRFVKIGPGRNSKSLERWLKIEEPVTSDGIRSGVNWMREKSSVVACAIERAISVFARPGKSSSRTWPSPRIPSRISSSCSRLRTIARSTSSTTRAESAPTSAIVIVSTATARSCLDPLDCVDDRLELVVRRARRPPIARLLPLELARPLGRDVERVVQLRRERRLVDVGRSGARRVHAEREADRAQEQDVRVGRELAPSRKQEQGDGDYE